MQNEIRHLWNNYLYEQIALYISFTSCALGLDGSQLIAVESNLMLYQMVDRCAVDAENYA